MRNRKAAVAEYHRNGTLEKFSMPEKEHKGKRIMLQVAQFIVATDK